MSIVSNLISAIFSPSRTLGPIAAQVTIEEHHLDELIITNHPVELGAQITDHSYKNPSEVIIRCGWSNSGIKGLISEAANIIDLIEGGTSGIANYVQQVYAQLLALQASRIPFNIVTGKRSYRNMLFKSLSVTTDEKTEFALFVTAVCKQVIIVQTQVVSIPPREVQKTPELTQTVTDNGTQQVKPPVPVDDSIVYMGE